MAKDSLARGAKSATFSAGQAQKDEPIEFHGTVAVEEKPDSDESWQASEAILAKPDLSKYQPMNDRVLLRRIEEKKDSLIVEPEAFARKPTKAEVIAVGQGMMIGGELRPIDLMPGDIVFYGEYNAEDIEIEGEKLLIVSAFDIRLRVYGA